MNIKELLELGDKRTPTLTLEDAVDLWDLSKIGSMADVEFFEATPQMESKLREIVDILPEIKEYAERCVATALLEKIEKWEGK